MQRRAIETSIIEIKTSMYQIMYLKVKNFNLTIQIEQDC